MPTVMPILSCVSIAVVPHMPIRHCAYCYCSSHAIFLYDYYSHAWVSTVIHPYSYLIMIPHFNCFDELASVVLMAKIFSTGFSLGTRRQASLSIKREEHVISLIKVFFCHFCLVKA